MVIKNSIKYLKYIIILFAILILFLVLYPKSFNCNTEDCNIVINKNMNAISVAKLLKENNFIYSEYVFIYTMRALLKDKSIKVGEFFIPNKISAFSLINYITNSNNTYKRKIKFIEGLTTKEFIEILNNNVYLIGKITTEIGEGTLMPDTYFFSRGDTRDSIVESMQTSMSKYLNDLWLSRDKNLPYKTQYEALIMASLIEKEAALDIERDVIAGVFVNRLKKGMRLQTDPTVAYGLGKINADKLTKKDLATSTPYNTYIIKALPPTPIGNPSRKSLDATFFPDKHNYLYFVATVKGAHLFSDNLKDHNEKVKDWRNIEKTIRQNQAVNLIKK